MLKSILRYKNLISLHHMRSGMCFPLLDRTSVILNRSSQLASVKKKKEKRKKKKRQRQLVSIVKSFQ